MKMDAMKEALGKRRQGLNISVEIEPMGDAKMSGVSDADDTAQEGLAPATAAMPDAKGMQPGQPVAQPAAMASDPNFKPFSSFKDITPAVPGVGGPDNEMGNAKGLAAGHQAMMKGLKKK